MTNKTIIKHGNRSFTKGQIVKHFKRELHSTGTDYLYQIVGTAKHTEIGETMVIYVPLYDVPSMADVNFAARPIDMFMSEVDHEKYPNIKQQYRFEAAGPLDIMELNDVNDEFDSMTSVYMKIPKEALAKIYSDAREVPKDDCLEQNDDYIFGEVEYNFEKDTFELQEVLIRPVYSDEDGGEIAGDFINTPDSFVADDVVAAVLKHIPATSKEEQ